MAACEEEFRVEIEEGEGYCLVQMAGEVVGEPVYNDLRAVIRDCLEQVGEGGLVIGELTRVSYISLECTGPFLGASRRAADNGRRFCLAGTLSPSVARKLGPASGFPRVIAFYDSAQAALAPEGKPRANLDR